MNKKYINIVENDLTVEVIIGINVSAFLSSHISTTTLNVSESILPNNQISSLFNPVPILYFALKNWLSSIWMTPPPIGFLEISKRYSSSAISRKRL